MNIALAAIIFSSKLTIIFASIHTFYLMIPSNVYLHEVFHNHKQDQPYVIEEKCTISAHQGRIISYNDTIWAIDNVSEQYSNTGLLSVRTYFYDGTLIMLNQYEDIDRTRIPDYPINILRLKPNLTYRTDIEPQHVIPHAITCGDTLTYVYGDEYVVPGGGIYAIVVNEEPGLSMAFYDLVLSVYYKDNDDSEYRLYAKKIIGPASLQNVVKKYRPGVNELEIWIEYVTAGTRYYYYHMMIMAVPIEP